MNSYNIKSPILFIIYNRPDVTSQVFQKIREMKPSTLFVTADGPKTSKDLEKCKATRDIIKVDWKCDVYTNFSEQNLGCKYGVSSGINWFFDNVEAGIILEDDCLPVSSFFRFCDILLDYYRYDSRVMHIGGTNFLPVIPSEKNSYYFSIYSHIWGWASWKRAWKYYDVEMSSLPGFIAEKNIENIFNNRKMQKQWLKQFQKIYDKKVDTWDYQWLYTVLVNGGLCAYPNQNMISNIGFGKDATHTKKINKFANCKTYELENIIHPDFLLSSKYANNYTFKNSYYTSFYQRVINKINREWDQLFDK